MRDVNLDLRRRGAMLSLLTATLAIGAMLLSASSARADTAACSTAQIVVHLNNNCVLVGTPESVCPPSQSLNLGGICIGGAAPGGTQCRTGQILVVSSGLCATLGTPENCKPGQVPGSLGVCVFGSRDSIVCTSGTVVALIGSGCLTVGTTGACPPDQFLNLLNICIAPNPPTAQRRSRALSKQAAIATKRSRGRFGAS